MATLINAETSEILLPDLEIASTFWQRFKGLQLRRALSAESGLLITPCSSLHTCFMRFAIDVIMLDENHSVLGTKKSLAPWRIAICERGTTHVIETYPGSIEVAVGTRLTWE